MLGQISEAEILQSWLHAKQSRSFLRLLTSQTAAFELKSHRGPRIWYGFLRFECEPADELSFQRTAGWPATLSASYVLSLDRAIVEGIVEGLFTDSLYPYSGCKLTCVEVKWDDVGSSAVAFYETAINAMQTLRQNGQWEYVSRRRRENQA